MLINAQVVRFVNSDQTIFASDVNKNLDILKSYNFPLINYCGGLTLSEIEQLVGQPFGESKACYITTRPPNLPILLVVYPDPPRTPIRHWLNISHHTIDFFFFL